VRQLAILLGSSPKIAVGPAPVPGGFAITVKRDWKVARAWLMARLLGAVASFLVLSIAGLTSEDADSVRGAYVGMNLIGQFMIVPLSLAALVTGLIQSLYSGPGISDQAIS
jgi:hypothetical protein